MMAAHPLDVHVAFRFLRGLAKNNDRNWFAENRRVYDETIKPQWEDFIMGLLIANAAFDERFAYVDPRSCMFRIYRDVRFAKDKSPYKPYLSAFLSPRGWRGSTPGFYVSLEPGGESVFAAGIYVPEKPALALIRARHAEGDRDFDRIVRAKTLGPYLPLDLDPLKVMPRGYPKEHPRANLLRARRYMLRRAFTDRELREGNAFALFRTAMKHAAPFVAWLDQFVSATPA